MSFYARIAKVFLQQKLLFQLLLVLHLMGQGSPVKIETNIRIPRVGIVGQSVQLQCLYGMESGLYSVRWYLNDKQFYSFIFDNTPEKVDHRLPGTNVEFSSSNDTVLTLRELTPASEGTYRCEVMSEAPFFATSAATEYLTVVDLPETPAIEGVRRQYDVGDQLNATCTAADARPPATISFYVNEKQIHSESGLVQDLGVIQGSQRELFTTTSQLVLNISSQYGPKLTLKCRANVLSVMTENSVTAQLAVSSDSPSYFNAKVACGITFVSVTVAGYMVGKYLGLF